VNDENLPIAVRAGAIADRRDAHSRRNLRRRREACLQTTAKAPAASTARASRSTARQRPRFSLHRYPPSAFTDCGVKPTCPITGTFRFRQRESAPAGVPRPPHFTASAPLPSRSASIVQRFRQYPCDSCRRDVRHKKRARVPRRRHGWCSISSSSRSVLSSPQHDMPMNRRQKSNPRRLRRRTARSDSRMP